MGKEKKGDREKSTTSKKEDSRAGGVFDLERFETESFKFREAEVAVPELAQFFDGGAAVWKIRGLTGAEVARVRDSVTRAKDLEGLVERLAASSAKDKAEAVLEVFGIGGSEADDYVRRLTLLEIGSVAPKIRREHAVKVSEIAALAFYRLTDEIYNLTGKGKLGESSAFGMNPESGPVLPLVPGADSEGEGKGSFSN